MAESTGRVALSESTHLGKEVDVLDDLDEARRALDGHDAPARADLAGRRLPLGVADEGVQAHAVRLDAREHEEDVGEARLREEDEVLVLPVGVELGEELHHVVVRPHELDQLFRRREHRRDFPHLGPVLAEQVERVCHAADAEEEADPVVEQLHGVPVVAHVVAARARVNILDILTARRRDRLHLLLDGVCDELGALVQHTRDEHVLERDDAADGLSDIDDLHARYTDRRDAGASQAGAHRTAAARARARARAQALTCLLASVTKPSHIIVR